MTQCLEWNQSAFYIIPGQFFTLFIWILTRILVICLFKVTVQWRLHLFAGGSLGKATEMHIQRCTSMSLLSHISFIISVIVSKSKYTNSNMSSISIPTSPAALFLFLFSDDNLTSDLNISFPHFLIIRFLLSPWNSSPIYSFHFLKYSFFFNYACSHFWFYASYWWALHLFRLFFHYFTHACLIYDALTISSFVCLYLFPISEFNVL